MKGLGYKELTFKFDIELFKASKKFKFGIWKLSFGLAQDGELAEPFVICHLVLVIYFLFAVVRV